MFRAPGPRFEVDVEAGGHAGVDVPEEAQKLLVAMPRLALGDDLAGGHVQGGKDGRGTVTDVAMRDAFDVSEPEGQERLGSLERLGLALLVDAEHHRVVGRVEVESDDIADLPGEERIGGELEVLMGSVVGVGVDSRDHVFIVHRQAPLNERTEIVAAQDPPTGECCVPAPYVLEFDPEGNLVNAWGGPGEGYTWPASSHGISVDPMDNLWIGGNGPDSHILKFSRDGRRQPGLFFAVHSIATDSQGNIYTTETYEGKRVQKFLYKGLGPVTAMNQGAPWPRNN